MYLGRTSLNFRNIILYPVEDMGVVLWAVIDESLQHLILNFQKRLRWVGGGRIVRDTTFIQGGGDKTIHGSQRSQALPARPSGKGRPRWSNLLLPSGQE
jgi:hypothetical protein